MIDQCIVCGIETETSGETQMGGDGYGGRCAGIADVPCVVNCDCGAGYFDGDHDSTLNEDYGVYAPYGFDPQYPKVSVLFLAGRCIGKLQPVNHDLIKHSPGIQPWSQVNGTTEHPHKRWID